MPRLVAGDKRLSGAEFKALYTAVLDAYDELEDLERVLRFALDKRLSLIVSKQKGLEDVVYTVIAKADTDGWSAELLQAVRATKPTNQRLLVFAQRFELAPATPAGRELELLIKQGDQFLDVVGWRTKLAERESVVCRIECDREARGTGFLLGPSVVMTNYHVVEDLVKRDVEPARIRLRFDYKLLGDGVELSKGQTYALANDWDIAHSPYSTLDMEVSPVSVPGNDELDYALLRVEGAPGDEPVSSVNGTDAKGPPRGFVPLPPLSPIHDWGMRRDLMILQHPDGQPLKLAMRTDAVSATLPDPQAPTRVRYSTRTAPGSSGSPCFDMSWKLVALHHGGDPKYAKFDVSPEWNQGIPLAAILRSLDEDVLSQLGEEEV